MSGFKGFYNLLKGNRVKYLLGLLCMSILDLSQIFIATIFLVLFDGIVAQDTGMVLDAIYGLLALTLLLTALVLIGFTLIKVSSIKAISSLRAKAFNKMLNLPQQEYSNNHSGDFTSRVTNDIQVLEKSLTQHFTQLTGKFIGGIGCIIYMFILNWKFALGLLAWNFINLGITSLFIKPMKEKSDQVQKKLGDTTTGLSDIVAGSSVIKLFNLKTKMAKKFKQKNKFVYESALKRVKLNSVMRGLNNFLTIFSFVGFIAIASVFILRGDVSFGQVLAINQLQNGVGMFFKTLGEFLNQVQESFAGLDRVNELLDKEEEPTCFEKMPTIDINSAIAFENVNFSYNCKDTVLNNISFEVEDGETVAIVGPSGGGKSTIFKLLLGLYQPKNGSMSYFSTMAHDYSIDRLRSLTAYVPQEPYLFNGTIKENIAYGKKDATDYEIFAAAKAANAHKFILSLENGYDTMVGERGIFLSGGQKQRVAIARAIIKDAPILLLDEATSSLDNESEKLVQNAINNLMQNKTTLIIAHRLSTIENADRILVVDNGQIVESGTHSELLNKKGVYAHLDAVQFSKKKGA
ncbi:ABC transporter ATP-binding protein [Proteinivorax tanatarense]|uniref:ABC transporter ATP-binding protein n=1 Tax=Proteinivorax tanatarense TaxID=1260629 RepID=A0AAU7VP08_9FIRM